MLKHNAGTKVGKGMYWNFSTGERIDISAEGILPGGKNDVYYRLPATGILVLAPVLGLLYAAFLPFIGIAMLVKVVLKKVASAVTAPTQRAASFGWRPSESHLAGKKKAGAEKPGKKEDKDEVS